MRQGSSGILLLAVLLGALAPAARAAPVRVSIIVPPGARAFYSLPGTPVLRPAPARLELMPLPGARGSYTFVATAPGCLPAFRQVDVAGLRGGREVRLSLTPAPYRPALLASLVAGLERYSPPPRTRASFEGGGGLISPDGRGLAYARSPRVEDLAGHREYNTTEIWWCPLRPAKALRVARSVPPASEGDIGFIPNLSFSPDGEWLAYSLARGAQEDIHLLNLFTGERRMPFARPRISEYLPTWSPDGSRLAYVTEDTGPDERAEERQHFSLRLARCDGADDRLVASGICDTNPAFSPDGAFLAYACPDGLRCLDLRARVYRRLAPGVTPAWPRSEALAWSPDGAWLAFRAAPTGYLPRPGRSEESCLRLVSRDGEQVRRLTRCEVPAAWLPDGTLLLSRIIRWTAERGAYPTGAVLDTEGRVLREVAVPDLGSPYDDNPRDWVLPESAFPPLPTLPVGADDTPGRSPR